MPISLELMPLEERPPEPPPAKTLVVRYGYLRYIGEFPSDIQNKIGCGTKVIIKTDRGTEIAEMLTSTCSNGGCSKAITREKMLAYFQASGGADYPFHENGRVLRVATTQDLAEQAKLDEDRQQHLLTARELVVRHNLPMKIVEVEHVLGGERILFYFTSEHRVDFRSLVRDLAHQLHTRIELRQVGARDEARITADYEKCGQHCCCKQFLKVLTPISMKAAKVQKATLDPAKISGRCGRLMCCLRYEDETYDELRKKLPKRNTRVRTEKGVAWVVDGQILTQLVLVQYDDFKREAVPIEHILEFDLPRPTLPDGRVMQSPNDRPPPPPPEANGNRTPGGPNGPGARGPQRGPGGPRQQNQTGGPQPGPRPPGGPQGPRGPRGPGGPPQRQGGPPRQQNQPPRGPAPQQRPMPGSPASPPPGDPLAENGPTGGDLNVPSQTPPTEPRIE